MEELNEEQLEQITGGCHGRWGGQRRHHGYGHGHCGQGGYGEYGYQGPSVAYSNHSFEQDISFSSHTKSSDTTYNVY